ncbi:MAG: hypothetical protein PHD81_00520 [Candidatus Nanoarchaeia archaeon]|nr:hypothetical protein [Candidatus Nanoarchaeia archaeon]MDD5587573.1 hypothetical protein [Candidatus Nanoarchaeia archaeon]
MVLDGNTYLLLLILGLSLGNLYGLKRIFILEQKIEALDLSIARLRRKR